MKKVLLFTAAVAFAVSANTAFAKKGGGGGKKGGGSTGPTCQESCDSAYNSCLRGADIDCVEQAGNPWTGVPYEECMESATTACDASYASCSGSC